MIRTPIDITDAKIITPRTEDMPEILEPARCTYI